MRRHQDEQMILKSHRFQNRRLDTRVERGHRVGAVVNHLEYKISSDLVEKKERE